MASTVTNDPNVVDANPVKYSRALQIAAGGHVLWHPSHIERDGGIIGDCGYFDGGRFQVLFNVFDPPTELGIPALPRPTGRELRVEDLPNYNTILQSSHSHTIRVEASLESPPLPNLPVLKIELAAQTAVSDQTIAFLAFCGPRRRSNWYAKTSAMEKYLLSHEEKILQHFEGYPIRPGNIVIVSGTTRTVSWWGGIARSHSTSVSGRAGIEGTGFGVEVDNTQNWPWTFSRGPEIWEEDCAPNRALVLRVVSIKRRLTILRATRKVFTTISDFAGAGLRREGTGNTGANAPTGDSAARRYSNLGVRDNQIARADQGNAALSEQSDSLDGISDPGDGADDDHDADLNNTLLAAQPDLLSEILDLVLLTYPDVDVAVGSWDTIAGSAKLLGATFALNLCEAVEPIVARLKQGTNVVAELRGLKLRASPQRTSPPRLSTLTLSERRGTPVFRGDAYLNAPASLASSLSASTPTATVNIPGIDEYNELGESYYRVEVDKSQYMLHQHASESSHEKIQIETGRWLKSHAHEEHEENVPATDDELEDYEAYGRAAAIAMVQDGRSLIVHGQGVSVSELQIAPGTTHLLLAASTTPQSLPSFLAEAIPKISITLLALDISGNSLVTLPSPLALCVNLEELNVTANPLRALPEVLSNLAALRVLIADDTGLQTPSIPAALSSLSNLHTLSLRCNKLHALPAWLCLLPNLETLLVDGNPFTGPWDALVQPLLTKFPTTSLLPPNSLLLGTRPSDSILDDSTPSSAPLATTSYFPTQEAGHDDHIVLEAADSSRPANREWDSPDQQASSRGTQSTTRGSFLPIDRLSIVSSTDTLTSSYIPSSWSATTVGEDDPGTDSVKSLFSGPTPQSATPSASTHPQRSALRLVMAYLRDLADLSAANKASSSATSSVSLLPVLSQDRSLGMPDSSNRQRGPTIGERVTLDDSLLSPSLDPKDIFKDTQAKEYKDHKGKRNMIVREIVETERAYVKALQELVDIYIKPAAVPVSVLGNAIGKETVVPASERKIAFSCLESLLLFHKESFLPALEAAAMSLNCLLHGAKADTSITVAEAIAIVFLSHEAFMKMYSTYINNFDNSIDRVKDWTKSSDTGSTLLSKKQRKRIETYLKRCRVHPRHSQLDLEGYLLLPVQRIPRYRLLLEELVRSTPPKSHNDPLPRALSVISALANDMDEGKRDAERRKNLVLWQSRIRGKFPSPLVQPHRRFIMDGNLMLTRVVRKSTTSSEVVHSGAEKTVIQVDCLKTESSSRHLVAILCNDLLVLCKDSSDGKDPAALVDLWAVLRMQTLPQPASVMDGNVLRIVDNKAILYLQTASTSEALSWSRAINLHVPALKD